MSKRVRDVVIVCFVCPLLVVLVFTYLYVTVEENGAIIFLNAAGYSEVEIIDSHYSEFELALCGNRADVVYEFEARDAHGQEQCGKLCARHLVTILFQYLK